MDVHRIAAAKRRVARNSSGRVRDGNGTAKRGTAGAKQRLFGDGVAQICTVPAR